MSIDQKPDTLRNSSLRERLKVTFLSGHLRQFPRHEKTLDIGCGWGFSLHINPAFYCVDADSACIEHLQSRGANARLADVSSQLPFTDSFFDNAFTHDVLEHLEEEEMLQLFIEARRVIRAGGIFMNIVPNRRGYDAGLDPAVGFVFERAWATPLPRRFSEFFIHNKLVTVCRAA
jgi:cyclopropane fatty-acyl-phospholipid synthase-like methyltransferase